MGDALPGRTFLFYRKIGCGFDFAITYTEIENLMIGKKKMPWELPASDVVSDGD